MKVTMEATNPDQIEFTLTATMKLADWLEVSKRIHEGAYVHSIHELDSAISSVAFQAARRFLPEKDEE